MCINCIFILETRRYAWANYILAKTESYLSVNVRLFVLIDSFLNNLKMINISRSDIR